MLLIDNETVEKILDMRACMEALETGYRDLSAQRAVYRGRIDVFVPSDDRERMYRWGTMEGASRTFETMAIRVKSDMLTWPEGKTVENYCMKPGTYCGLVLVFSTRNAEPLAIINDGVIQHMRVGGCAGLGAKYLAREDAGVVGMIGSGGMARTCLTALNEVRKLRNVKVYSPTRKHRDAYAREMGQKLGIRVTPMDGLEETVRGSDIVATCTDSIRVVVDDPAWIEDGMHLTCTKPTEWSPAILELCDLVIQTGRTAIRNLDVGMRHIAGHAALVAGSEEETGRIANPRVAAFRRERQVLSDIMSGRLEGRTNDRQKTFYINSGTQGLQFASTAGYVVREAKRRGLGREIPTSWFLQDIRN